MNKIEFSPEALKDIEGLEEYLISEYGKITATKNIRTVMESIRSLIRFPLQGASVWDRYGIESDYRYLFSNHNYVFYRVEDDAIKIIRIIDARCDFTRILFGN
ncbi:MAG: type II toxin-antitoxin system RelE/ParE family toxin, partial [Dehalococcoidales bacterium]|nr:type II toxin-antitoxin system RelE/ParE family toxin [Dehalococcoidales bacterium]